MVDEPEPVAVATTSTIETSTAPASACGSGMRTVVVAAAPSGTGTERYRGRKTSTRPSVRARDLRQRPGERVDHVTEAAGLRPRLAFGRDERDSEGLGHRLMVTTGAGRLAVRKVRRVH